MVNRISVAKQKQILNLLVEGNSMRASSRIADASINTVTKLMIDAGRACARFHDVTVRKVRASRIQCDEIWSFCYAKRKNVDDAIAAPDWAGDVWTWTALDADTKLIIGWLVTLGRDGHSAAMMMDDLRSRVVSRPQLTTDGLHSYLEAVEGAFGDDVDYAQLVKIYGEAPPEDQRRYSPVECVGAVRRGVSGEPDPDYISTSYVERHNLTLRMGNRRFTRLTNAFSKKLENHAHMLALCMVHYNFCRPHGTLNRANNGYRTTPAMAAGLADRVYDFDWLVEITDRVRPRPTKRGSYSPRPSLANSN